MDSSKLPKWSICESYKIDNCSKWLPVRNDDPYAKVKIEVQSTTPKPITMINNHNSEEVWIQRRDDVDRPVLESTNINVVRETVLLDNPSPRKIRSTDTHEYDEIDVDDEIYEEIPDGPTLRMAANSFCGDFISTPKETTNGDGSSKEDSEWPSEDSRITEPNYQNNGYQRRDDIRQMYEDNNSSSEDSWIGQDYYPTTDDREFEDDIREMYEDNDSSSDDSWIRDPFYPTVDSGEFEDDVENSAGSNTLQKTIYGCDENTKPFPSSPPPSYTIEQNDEGCIKLPASAKHENSSRDITNESNLDVCSGGKQTTADEPDPCDFYMRKEELLKRRRRGYENHELEDLHKWEGTLPPTITLPYRKRKPKPTPRQKNSYTYEKEGSSSSQLIFASGETRQKVDYLRDLKDNLEKELQDQTEMIEIGDEVRNLLEQKLEKTKRIAKQEMDRGDLITEIQQASFRTQLDEYYRKFGDILKNDPLEGNGADFEHEASKESTEDPTYIPDSGIGGSEMCQ